MSAPQVSPGKPRVLKCPGCGGAITLRASGHSVNVACAQCSTLLDVSREEVRIIKKSLKHQKQPLIPLGSRGRLQGTEWEVIGYLRRGSGGGLYERYNWDEYLLYNPWQGFRFLTQAQGHWTLYRNLKSFSEPPDTSDYALFFRGEATVEYVLGEFYWRVKQGDRVQVTDSIRPPHVLSVEKDGSEIVASLGVYLPAKEVAAAFALSAGQLPVIHGVASNQPSPYSDRLPGVLKAAALTLVASLAIQLVQAKTARNEQVTHDAFTLTATNRNEPRVSEAFRIGPQQTNLCINSRAALANNWAELNVGLVSESTYQRRNLLLGMEYYSGYEDGSQWSEGDPTASGCFSAVAPGSYRLVVDADAGTLGWGGSGDQEFSYATFQDAPIWSNWLALLLVLLPYPFYLWIRHHSFEYTRWSESDYMPATYASIQQSLKGEEDA